MMIIKLYNFLFKSSTPKEAGEEGPLPRQPVNKGDSMQIKRLLDEVATQVITETGGYPEDHTAGNFKISVGLVTCSAALVAQFWPKTSPYFKLVQIVCVALYVLLSALLQAYTTYWEGDSIVITKAKTGTSGAGLRLSSDLQRFSDAYSLTLSSGVGGPAAPPPAELKKSIAQWFYEDGHLAEDVLKKDVLALLKKYEKSESPKQR